VTADADFPRSATGPTPHPTPQLARARWFDLGGAWSFTYDDADVGLEQGWADGAETLFDRKIQVPFPPESAASGIGDTGFHRVLWYRRTFTAPHASGEGLLLHFAAVDYAARVWVDGHLVVEHTGGHTPFTADVSDVVRPGGEHTLVVRAYDDPKDREQPRGKQDWKEEPHAIWYSRTSGIWRTVWLEPVPRTRIAELRWTPDVDESDLGLEVRLNRVSDAPLQVRLRLTQHGHAVTVSEASVIRDRASIDVRLPHTETTLDREEVLWSPEFPNLFDAEITLLEGTTAVDEVRSYAGLRSVTASESGFQLNGRPYFLRLVLDQCFWPESHLALPDAGAARREVELIRELGFNGVRLHQKAADPEFLYWCDQLGVLVWAEMPAAYEFSPRMIDRLTREWLEVLNRDYSHPSVIAWVPFNESWGVPVLPRSQPQRDLVQALYWLTKALDPTRLVIGNDGWEQVVTDVITVHDYTARPEVLTSRYGNGAAVDATLREVRPGYRSVLLPGLDLDGQPLMITEFGGITYDIDSGPLWGGYSAVDSPEHYLDRYRGLINALLDSRNVAGFCYTQLTDVQQERNGLLTADRRPKVDAVTVSHINRRPSAAVPADQIGSFEYGDYPPTVMDIPLG
jgi:beta-galactosidase/beta-glucuronidase